MVWMRRWALLAIGVPLAAWLLDTVAESLERRGGQTSTTRGMRSIAQKGRSWRQGRRGRRGRRVGR